MGKQFITDEVNDMYTARVTSAGKLKVEDGAATFKKIDSAYCEISAHKVYDGACYLKSLIIGQLPATAASIQIFDCSTGQATSVSAFGTSGDNVVAVLNFQLGALSAGISAGASQNQPFAIPFNVYCASGLCVGNTSALTGLAGATPNITVVYQA